MDRSPIEWDAQPLGKVSDMDLARRLGRDPSTVREARTSRGIKAFPRGKGIDWDRELQCIESDVEIARRLGVTAPAVFAARRARGIKARLPLPITKTCVECRADYLSRRVNSLRCAKCRAKIAGKRSYRKSAASGRHTLAGVRRRAKLMGLECDITPEWFRRSIAALGGKCPVCAGDVARGGRFERTPSIDRLDPLLGYTVSNCWLICMQCNSRKNRWSIDEWSRWITQVRVAANIYFGEQPIR